MTPDIVTYSYDVGNDLTTTLTLMIDITTPQNIKAIAGNGQVTLNWDAVKGATKYAVSVYSGGKYFVQTMDLTDTTYTVMPLKNGVTYQFLVQAYINGKWTTASTADLITATPNA